MRKLSGEISTIIVEEYGREELLRRLADPFFFQALSCVMGFDWHSSGTTTTTMGALKEAIKPEELGVAVCGGKGKVSRKTPDEIEKVSGVFSLSSKKVERLKYASRMAAKVDNSCVQDGYQLYHHTFIMSEDGDWAVVQQGMNEMFARRYHWLSENVSEFVEEPHSGIASERVESSVLDMTAGESEEARGTSLDLVRDCPTRLGPYVRKAGQLSLEDYCERSQSQKILVMPARHTIDELTERTMRALKAAYEIQPSSYEELVSLRGIGPKSIRALALVSELVYGKPPSWKDPTKYCWAHGGKDGIPYPVDRPTYQKTIDILKNAIDGARLGNEEKLRAVRRLHDLIEIKTT